MPAFLCQQTNKIGSTQTKTTDMKNIRTLAFGILSLFAAHFVAAQNSDIQSSLEFKIQLLSDNGTYGVFVKPDHTISPSGKTQTGSGQVTLVTPTGFDYKNLKNHSGTWVENARVDSPMEAVGKSYVSFGFVVDNPRIKLFPNEETLLFTFTCDPSCVGQINLFNNENDPFATPNSYDSNPGNDLGVIDLGTSNGMVFYTYARNYSTESADYRNNAALASKK